MNMSGVKRISMKSGAFLVSLYAVLVFVLPVVVYAQTGTTSTSTTTTSTAPTTSFPSLIPACALGDGRCGTCDFLQFFANGAALIEYLLSAVVLGMIVIGGFFWITSAGNSERVSKGKAIMGGAIVGALIVMLGYIMVNTTIGAFVGATNYSDVSLFASDTSGKVSWYNICTTPAASPTSSSTTEACSSNVSQLVTAAALDASKTWTGRCVATASACTGSAVYNGSATAALIAGDKILCPSSSATICCLSSAPAASVPGICSGKNNGDACSDPTGAKCGLATGCTCYNNECLSSCHVISVSGANVTANCFPSETYCTTDLHYQVLATGAPYCNPSSANPVCCQKQP